MPANFENKDTQGILYWLGTSGDTEEWKNAAESGLVKITRSSYGHGKASDVADRKGSWCSTSNKANQWWKIDFGDKRSILPSAYTLQVESSWMFGPYYARVLRLTGQSYARIL